MTRTVTSRCLPDRSGEVPYLGEAAGCAAVDDALRSEHARLNIFQSALCPDGMFPVTAGDSFKNYALDVLLWN
ncbi:hypothetical protein [Yoonia sp.]|uniref:hypothetical protein n=1 Tax=Yoonia sp. TaxID=2212373 RepID=UPI003F6A71E0